MGRKPKGPRITFQFEDAPQMAAVDAVAAEESELRGKKVSRSDIVREMLAYGLAARERARGAPD